MRATPNSWHSTRSAGNGAPGASWPVWIASTRRWRISAETVRRATGSKLVTVASSPTSDAAGEARMLGGDVERLDDGLVLRLAPVLGGTSHITSNSSPSGSLAYRLLFAPWSLAPDQRAGSRRRSRISSSSCERRHLPRDVVHADGAAPGLAGADVADREEGDVVVVVGRRRPHEHERARRDASMTVENPSTSR